MKAVREALCAGSVLAFGAACLAVFADQRQAAPLAFLPAGRVRDYDV